MKKLLIVLALLASFQVANAQGGAAAAKKAVDAALAASQNAKKATKVATWMKLADSYIAAYNVPSGNVWVGAAENELRLAMGNEKPTSVENVILGGAQYTKQIFENKNLYINSNGQLEIIEVTKPVVDNALDKALDAYRKAAEVDPKATKAKEIAAGIKGIVDKYNTEAYNAYTFGDFAKAESFFSKAFDASSQKPSVAIDTSALYNAGFVTYGSGQFAKAKNYFDKCLKLGYYAKDGEVFAKLADCVAKLDTTAAGKTLQKEYLEQGFAKFPQSQGIMIGLINYYITSGQDTDKLFSLIDAAKANEPENASLYYVEGNARAQLGQIDEAVKAYEKCVEVNPEYEYGFIGEGIMFYNEAIKVQEAAQTELDDNKYMALVQKFETYLKSCIEPFEKAYNMTKNEEIKPSLAEYLKNSYYRFREEDPKYQAGYEKFSKLVQ
ncbi:MAG: tetratricopeptide repeat protein [Bacteroidales bacterium]|jgi:tetratricopeptide (TPR) repeat protein|nr:tetratricopeptide repeat protein [Bacteroidales bacterium]